MISDEQMKNITTAVKTGTVSDIEAWIVLASVLGSASDLFVSIKLRELAALCEELKRRSPCPFIVTSVKIKS